MSALLTIWLQINDVTLILDVVGVVNDYGYEWRQCSNSHNFLFNNGEQGFKLFSFAYLYDRSSVVADNGIILQPQYQILWCDVHLGVNDIFLERIYLIFLPLGYSKNIY